MGQLSITASISGVLEDEIAGRFGEECRRTLVWRNAFFGRRNKAKVRVGGLAKTAIPVHFRHPELLDGILQLVDLPQKIVNAVREHAESIDFIEPQPKVTAQSSADSSD